jgi:hypothetical protein
MVPDQPLPAYSFVVLRAAAVTKKLTAQKTGELGFHFAVILYRLVVVHRPVQINNPTGPDNAYLILQHKFWSNVTLLAGP